MKSNEMYYNSLRIQTQWENKPFENPLSNPYFLSYPVNPVNPCLLMQSGRLSKKGSYESDEGKRRRIYFLLPQGRGGVCQKPAPAVGKGKHPPLAGPRGPGRRARLVAAEIVEALNNEE